MYKFNSLTIYLEDGRFEPCLTYTIKNTKLGILGDINALLYLYDLKDIPAVFNGLEKSNPKIYELIRSGNFKLIDNRIVKKEED